MQTYLVGGAVRDKLLGLKPKDNDWVVVGTTPEKMLKLGYKPIFSSFPIFINSKTKEEYALARIEKKVSSGYHGFKTISNSNISLKDDLKRRDLTINSIAQDKDGQIIDPFNGLQDIKDRVLRHTSEAFKEDPLRVVRLARFKAQLSDFKFTIADETKTLVIKILTSGELNHLTKERLHTELIKSLKNPFTFFKCLDDLKALQIIFPNIHKNMEALPTESFFEDPLYKKSSIEQKITLTFYKIPSDSLVTIKTELNLSNIQYKLLTATANIYQIISSDMSAIQILQSIKNANILRNQSLYDSAITTIKNTHPPTKHLTKLSYLKKASDEILSYDLKSLLLSVPKNQLKHAIEQQQIDTINKYIKM